MTIFRRAAFLTILTILACSAAHAANDTCTTDGGTADCVGAVVSQFAYRLGRAEWRPSQEGAIAAFEAAVRADFEASNSVVCTFNIADNTPPWQPDPIGGGHAQQGTVGQFFWSQDWRLSREFQSQKSALPYSGTFTSPQDAQPCKSTFGPIAASIVRTRSVACPTGYTPNVSGVSNSYCYRLAAARDPLKVPGCKQCPRLGNPVHPSTGNKIQAEDDYVGAGAMPLRFRRSYNSRMPTDIPFKSPLGVSWRSTYDRFVQFSDGQLMPTVYAYREDGQTLHFKLTNGVFQPDADIADRLVRLSDAANNPIGWKYTVAESDDAEIYANDGKLIQVRSRAGLTQSLTYDSEGRLATVSDDFGKTLTFAYNVSGQLASLTDPDGQVYTYSYSTAGNVSAVSYPDGTVRTYHYNESAHTNGANRPYALTGITDESANRFSTYKYDQYERVASTEHAGSEKYSFSYTGSGAWNTSTTVTDPLLQQRVYTFVTTLGVDRNTSMSQPCGGNCGGMNSAAQSYDANGNVASRTDFKGSKTCYAYDAARNLETARLEGLASGLSCPADLTSYTPANGTRQRKITTQWHPTYRLPTQIDESGKRTTFTHDMAGNVLTRTITDLIATPNTSRAWAYTYNSYGRVLTADGPRTDVSDVTTYTYYGCTTGSECGQVHTVTNAAGHTTTYNTYNAHGQPLSITDANGVLTTLTYDLRQRLKSRTVGSEVTTFDYWPTGLLKKTTLPDGSYLEYTYDLAHRLTDINDADGNRTHYTLDAMGNRTKEESFDPSNDLAQKRVRVFDTLNRLQKEIGAAETAAVTTTYGYDNNGNQTSIAAPLGRDSTQGYDELNRLSQVTDPLNGVTRYGYNALDQLISVTDPKGLVTSYGYNALGDLQQQTSPDTGSTTNTYDSGGNLKTSADARNVVTTYTYDELNRVATASFAFGATADQTLTYSYDAGLHGAGRLTGVSDSDHSLAWTYDEQGRVLTATQTVGSVSKTTSYSYLNGLRQSLTTPSGQLITYGYTNGKVTSISVNGTLLVSNVLYEPFGPVRQWTWGNGTLSVRTFDDDGKITQIDSAGLKTYSYDDAFRITGITDTSDASLSWTYGYDDLDRLTSASKTGTALGYTYDANGNRLTQTGSGASTFTIDPNSNRLTSTSGALSRTYGYDNVGNATSFDGITFTYNNRGRMKSSTKNGVTTTYTYNALGQLIKKGASALYYYDEAGHILGIYGANGSLNEEIVWLGDTPLATLRPKAGGGVDLYYIHSDHLNTPRLVTEASSGSVRWAWSGDPFGGGAPNDDPNGLGVFSFNLRFAGQMSFSETGMHYNYYRDYDPHTGRYVQSDPIGIDGGLNTYLYADANPLSNIDPTGEQAIAVPVPGPVAVPGWAGPAGAVASAGWAGWAVGSAIYPHISEPLGDLIDKVCPPACNPPKGTVCFIIDRVPPSKPHYPIPGSHYHLWQMNQSPSGQCFWNKLGASGSAPPGAIPCPFTRPSR